jgi:hypothetical protein
MRSRLTLWALLGLSCAAPAAAQLASQTALVGTVTDSTGSAGAVGRAPELLSGDACPHP